MKKLWRNAKLLSSFAIISVVICILRIASMDANEWFPYAEECFAFVYDIALAYIASYIFYILQVYLPERSREKEMIPVLVIAQRNVQLFTINLVLLWESFYKNSANGKSEFKRKEIWNQEKMLEAAKEIKLLEDSDTIDFSKKNITWKEKIEIACHELAEKGNAILNYRLNLLPSEVSLTINYLINEGAMLKGLSQNLEILERIGSLTAEYSLYDVLPVDLRSGEKCNISRDIDGICLLIKWVNDEYNYINAESKGKYEKDIYRIDFS